MKINHLITFALVILALISCCQNQPNNKRFVLTGQIDGLNTEYVILSYVDSSNVVVSDTLPVKNGSFTKQGYLSNTQRVLLSSNLAGRYMEDPNRFGFFLEPSEIELSLIEGQFGEGKVSGSKTQIENENLEKVTKHFYDKIEVISQRRKELINRETQSTDGDFEIEINKLTYDWQKLLDKIKNVNIQYAVKNPKSYLSAYMVDFYKKKLPADSLFMLYSHLNPIIQESSYGLKILEQIEVYVVKTGDVAPNFSSMDASGNILSLDQFKGRTVLLDFGASWCVPCKDELPEIRKIFDEHHKNGLEIIGISFDKNESSWTGYIEKEELKWHNIYEGLSNVNKKGSISKAYYVQPIPAYILIDKKGVIVDRYRGAEKNKKDLSDLKVKLNTLLNPDYQKEGKSGLSES